MRSIFMMVFAMAISFYGCASVDTPEQAKKNELLEYTDKVSFMSDHGNILVVASYLNPIKYPKKLDEEIFGVAISPSNTSLDSAVLQGIGIAKIERANNDMAKEIGFYLPWASYYIIKAPALNANSLKLELILDGFKAKLNFVKVPRSLYWNR